MRILVTGGTGFLGRHLVWNLASKGYQVIFTGRQQNLAQEVIEHSPKPVNWLPLEHGHPETQNILTKAAEGAYAIVHCAALSSPWGAKEIFFNANVVSTQEVLNAVQICNIQRLIHISTPSIYFDFHDRYNIKENHTLPKPVNEYARTKAEAEKLVIASNLCDRVILRPRGLFGPWDRTLLPRLIRVMEQGAIPIMRGGNALLDLTYVENVVSAINLALTQPLAQPTSIYNVSNGESQNLNQLLALLAKQFNLELRTRKLPWQTINALTYCLEGFAKLTKGKEPLITRYSAGVLAFGQTLDISKIRQELSYTPQISLEEGLSLHARWFHDMKREIK